MFRDVDETLKAFKELERSSTPALREAFDVVSALAPTDATILIEGESGTGKRMIAEVIHELSYSENEKNNGVTRPFVPVNCATLPEALAPSVLFGHVRGAFTDAKEGRRGIVREAEGGTLFLDEIDKLSFPVQGMLLSFLQESEITPLGSAVPMKVNARVVAATNKNLERLVADGTFQEDLFNRISGFEVRVPRLSERAPGEILAIARYCLIVNHSKTPNRETKQFSEKTEEFILSYGWPGNVRQLEKAVTSGYYMAKGRLIMPEDLRIRRDHDRISPDSAALDRALKLAERRAEFINLLLHMAVREDTREGLSKKSGVYANELQVALDLFGNDPEIVAETLGLKDERDLEELRFLAETPHHVRQHFPQRSKILLSSCCPA